jgi:glycosyltransferase involved in cell wall biosynthesis
VHQVLPSHRIGGAAVLAIGLAGEVKARGAGSHVWVPGRGPATEALAKIGVGWDAYSVDRLRAGKLTHALELASIGRRLLPSRRAVVHVHNPLVYGMLIPLLRAIGVRAVVTFHIDPSPWEILWSLRHSPRAVVTCSEHIASQVRTVSEEAGRKMIVVAIPNAIDLERFAPGDRLAAKRHVGAAADRPLALMLANLAEHKGQITALRAVKALKDEGVRVDCWLAGEERGEARPFTSRLQALVAELGIGEQVRFLGFRSDGADLLRAADFFLLPSTHEGLPLSVLEAQAVGAIVLASPLPGIREVVVDGETGFLADPGHAREYAHRMKAILVQPELRARLETAARERVAARHNWALYAERTWQVYADVAAGRSRSKH